MPGILEDLQEFIFGKDEEGADTATRVRVPEEPKLSFTEQADALLTGVGEAAFGALPNTYFSVVTALDPEGVDRYQQIINASADFFGYEPRDLSAITKPLDEPRERVVKRTPIARDGRFGFQEEKITDSSPTLGERLSRAFGSPDQIYKDARKKSDTGLAAGLKVVSEMTVGPLSQDSAIIPNIPAVYDEERAKETQKQKLEQLPNRIAQASILWSMFGGALGTVKGKFATPKTEFGAKLVRQVEKDFDTMHKLAKSGIRDTIKEGVEVYTKQGKGKIVSADPSQFKEVMVKLRDGTEKAFLPNDIIADPRSVMEATGMKPGRLLLDPIKLDPRLIESGAMTIDELFETTVQQGGPALAKKVADIMKDDGGVGVMEAVGRAVAQGEAPEVDVVRLSKLLNLSMDDAAELVATNFKHAGELISKNAGKLKKGQLQNLFDTTARILPETRGQLTKAANEIMENPVGLDMILRANQRYRRIKRGAMLSNPFGAARDLLASTARTMIGAYEDVIADSVLAGSEVAGRVGESILRRGRQPKNFSEIYSRSAGSFEAIGLGGGDVVRKLQTNLKNFGDPEFDSWLRESTFAKLRGEEGPPRPPKFVVETNLDKVMALAEQFPDKFADVSKAISGDSTVRMLTLDQIAELRRATKNLKNQPGLRTAGKAVLEGMTTASDASILMRAMGDIELRRVAIGSRLLSFMKREGLTPEQLMVRLESPTGLDPVIVREFADAYEYGREVTFARKFEDTLVGQMTKMISQVPLSENVIGEFPYFNYNRIVFNWERNPIRAGLGMVKDTALGRLAGRIDEAAFSRELKALGITDVESPAALLLRKDMSRRAMEAASAEYAKFASGLALFSAATTFRYGKYAGPRWNEFDTQRRDPETGERIIESLKLWEPYATVVALAEAAKAEENGIPLNEVFTPTEVADLSVGVRNLERNSIFAFTRVPEIFERTGDPLSATGQVAIGLADTEIGKFLSFMRRAKDFSALTDVEIRDPLIGLTGKDELILPDTRGSLIPNIISSLPNNNWIRNLALPDFAREGATIYESDGVMKRELTRAGLLYGSGLKSQPALMRFNGSIGYQPRDVLGQGFSDRKVDIRYTRIFNDILQRTEDSPIAGVTNANALVILANRAATAVANSKEPEITFQGRTFKLEGPRTRIAHDVRRHIAQQAYENIRKEARTRAWTATAKTEPDRLTPEVLRGVPDLAKPAVEQYLKDLREQIERMVKENDEQR